MTLEEPDIDERVQAAFLKLKQNAITCVKEPYLLDYEASLRRQLRETGQLPSDEQRREY